MRSDIIDRVVDIIRTSVSERRRLKELEEETGIPSGSWKNVWSRKQRPTAHMIEAIARRWPHYAFWLVTGITDEANGHTAPHGVWTCGQRKSSPEVTEDARNYFDLKIFIQDSVYGMSGATNLNAIEEENPTDGEIAEAKQIQTSDNPEIQKLMDSFWDTDSKIPGKKFGDLDYAIATIAFEKRQKLAKNRFFDFDGEPENYKRYQDTIEDLQKKREHDRANAKK